MAKLRKPIILIFLFFFSVNSFSQDISGSWRWFEEEDKSFVIDLVKSDSTFQEKIDFVGTHCGVYHYGDRIDCALDEFSVFLKKKSEKIFTGKIKSAYSLTEFEIRLTYLEEDKKILWEVTKEGEGLFYFPLRVMLE